MSKNGKTPKSLEQLKAELEECRSRRVRLLKDREIQEKRMHRRDKKAVMAHREIERLKNSSKATLDFEYINELQEVYRSKLEDASASHRKFDEINRELKRVKSKIHQLSFDIKSLENSKKSEDPES
ncbi:hypothetical protein IKW75_02790 [Candidatus Saccharibacteria bacterium]|nr:hypothetical protein [Candidatus Saccharibacteria bacterium]